VVLAISLGNREQLINLKPRFYIRRYMCLFISKLIYRKIALGEYNKRRDRFLEG
jgi:hypothetical protein